MKGLNKKKWDSNTIRLNRLLGTDEGFFALALHSFIEELIKDIHPATGYSSSFPEKIDEFNLFLINQGVDVKERSDILNRIIKDHGATNGVRHNFWSLSKEESISMTYNFLQFCRLLPLKDCIDFSALESNVETVWDEKIVPFEQKKELKRLEFKVFTSQRTIRDYEEKIHHLEAAEQQEVYSREEMEAVRKELAAAQSQASGKKERIDELRRQMFQKEEAHRKAIAALQEMEPLKEHISYLKRLSNYSRTRREYERNILRLSPDQKEALGKIGLNHDFLIKGCAGTGKTLVLLKAFEKAFELEHQEHGLGLTGDEGKILLLTYTKALVRYDQYLSRILQQNPEEGSIMTAESFFQAKLREINPSWRIDYHIMKQLVTEHNTVWFLSDEELYTEIEDFILGGAVLEEEYIDKRIPRKGLRIPLNNKQRMEVWEAAAVIVEEMEARGVFSKNYAKLKILFYLQQNPGDMQFRDVSYIFVDEAQDLTAVELMTLKAIARRPVIMAGDTDQSIYGFSSPYARAGMQISGYTRILKLNFRNTVPIHDFAETYRTINQETGHDETQVSNAFREGPVPELVVTGRNEILPALIKKAAFFISKMDYAPENICFLAPTNPLLDKVSASLDTIGISSESHRDSDFDFANTGKVRLFTLHSSKGIDFPVVILYLPYLNQMPNMKIEKAALEKLYHNLVYVACTRAMDHLIIGIEEDSEYKSIQDLEKTWSLIAESLESE